MKAPDKPVTLTDQEIAKIVALLRTTQGDQALNHSAANAIAQLIRERARAQEELQRVRGIASTMLTQMEKGTQCEAWKARVALDVAVHGTQRYGGAGR